MKTLAQIDAELAVIGSKWAEYPTIGFMPGKEPIKNVPSFGHCVMEPSGYFCSPIAFSIRNGRLAMNG